MNNRIKSMIAGVVLVSSIITNTSEDRPLTIRERARMFEQQQNQPSNQQRVGRLQKDIGYVSKGGAETVDFARNRSLQSVRAAVDKIINDTDINAARDVVGHVRSKVRGMNVSEPEAAKRPSVRYLLNSLMGIPVDEQVEILNILQSELAMRAVAAMDEEEMAAE